MRQIIGRRVDRRELCRILGRGKKGLGIVLNHGAIYIGRGLK